VTLLVRAPTTYLPERRYALDIVLSEWLGLDYILEAADHGPVTLHLVGDDQDAEVVVPDLLFATTTESWLTEDSLPVLDRPLVPIVGLDPAAPLPVLYGSPGGDAPWTGTGNRIFLPIDVFGTVFFLLTRYEEVARPVRDDHDRFPASASLAAAGGFLERPVADESVELLWHALQSLWPRLERSTPTFRLSLTHDVDQPWAALGLGLREWLHGVAGDVGRRRDPRLAARRVLAGVDSLHGVVDRDPFNTFDFLMSTSERHNLVSTFFFLAGTTDPRLDGTYALADPPVARLLREIDDRGHEIGLHGSYATHRSSDLLRAERDALAAACHGVGLEREPRAVRQHFLRFDSAVTWRQQSDAGLTSDSTLGFADAIGFRAGTCRDFPVFDLEARRVLPLRERPLLVMDVSLLDYMELDLESAAVRVRQLVQACRRHAGNAVLLFHNSGLGGARQRAFYRELVDDVMG